jgi:hypothetical protein
MTLSPADLMPPVDRVAALLRTRTVGESSGLGGDTGPGDVTTFTDTTRPTFDEVQEMIAIAYDVVESRVRGIVSISLAGGVRHAVALYAAILIDKSFFDGTQAADLKDLFTDQIQSTNMALEAGTSIDAISQPSFGVIGVTSSVDAPPCDSLLDLCGLEKPGWFE